MLECARADATASVVAVDFALGPFYDFGSRFARAMTDMGAPSTRQAGDADGGG
jgi:hypothetical protein